ncbi:MAG: putative NAD/FAD-binding protein [Cellvibrionaceae bacterium]|jgi:predicted NAD/FAD-binding protein
MKIAIIGAGISGLTAAYVLNREHDITLYEADDRVGGHTATKDVNFNGRDYAIDTGFIVFNDWTYPSFKALLKQIGVDYQPAEMGFSVTCELSGLEYSGNNLNAMFAQRRNLFKLSHWQMISDILKFNKEALADVGSGGDYLDMTLGDYLSEKSYSEAFIEKYLIPMGAAIWSASCSVIKKFPLQFFVCFFRNHGLLSVNDRPQWHVIKGGSRSYIDPLIEGFKDKVKTNSPVMSIVRHCDGVTVKTADASQRYDQIVIATHSDQALRMIADASTAEKNILTSIPYQKNEVVLHTDTSILPKKRSTWSSWNYRIVSNDHDDGLLPVLTYDMNILQSIDSDDTFCVTLNNTEAIDKSKVLGTYYYDHPVFSVAGINAQQRWSEINGVNRTWFCGAYWGNGFHEDGVVSALKVTKEFGVSL